MKKFHFQFSIVDTSGDGHDMTEVFYASSSKGELDIKKAWSAAELKLPKHLHPNFFCNEYTANMLPRKVATELIKRGCQVH